MSRREHIAQLSAETGIPIRLFKKPMDGHPHTTGVYIPAKLTSGWRTSGGEWLAPNEAAVFKFDGRNQYGYFAALHEIGHGVLGHVREKGLFGTSGREVIRQEAEAWLWALEHAKEPPNSSTRYKILDSKLEGLGSYIQTHPWVTELPDEVTRVRILASKGGQR